MAIIDTYRDLLTCDECGCFLSKHDRLCSKWIEPDDEPIPYVLTDRGRAAMRTRHDYQ
jgi:hypothetical protein